VRSCCRQTSSNPESERFDAFRSQGIEVRHGDFDDPPSLTQAFSGCERLFLVSSPKTEMDYNDAPAWQGREKHHRAAIEAALDAGVKHIYYTSLAFANPSKAAVMRCHSLTEDYLHDLEEKGKVTTTIIREGLYNEGWPLAFGYYFDMKNDTRSEILVAGDGPMSWASVEDLTFGTANVLAAPSERFAGKTLTMSTKRTLTLKRIAEIVSKIKGRELQLKIVSKKQFVDHYAERGIPREGAEWWVGAYEAMEDGECVNNDSTLEDILEEAGRSPHSLEATIQEMMK
jgi:uncharacterized protein YbjT (DUF2867 family)